MERKEATEGKGLSVLVVGDFAGSRSLFQETLAGLGHDCRLVEGGRQAVEELACGSYHLVFCDVDTADMDGLEILNQLKDKGWDLPFVIVTRDGRLDEAMEALRRGADDFLVKPVAPTMLAHRILAVMERRRARNSRHQRMQLEAALATAGAAAHELNQPLASLLISAEMLEAAQETTEIKRLARVISEQCQRLGKTTRQLVSLVRYQTKTYLGDQEILDLETSTRLENSD